MDRNTAAEEIQELLGFRTGQSETIYEAMQTAQRILERGRTLPWFLIEQDAQLSLTEGVASVAVPEGFIRSLQDDNLYTLNDGAKVFIYKNSLSWLEKYHATTAAGRPSAYALQSETFYFFPTPDADYTAYITYYKKAELLTTNVENAWLEHNPELLIGRAGMYMATKLRDPDGYAACKQQYDEAWKDMIADDVEREIANDNIVMGSEFNAS